MLPSDTASGDILMSTSKEHIPLQWLVTITVYQKLV